MLAATQVSFSKYNHIGSTATTTKTDKWRITVVNDFRLVIRNRVWPNFYSKISYSLFFIHLLFVLKSSRTWRWVQAWQISPTTIRGSTRNRTPTWPIGWTTMIRKRRCLRRRAKLRRLNWTVPKNRVHLIITIF